MTSKADGRRDELLELAATMFAERGLRATTVRDIADGAGILSGSLYRPLLLQGGDGRRVVASFSGLAVRPLPRNRGQPGRSAGAAQGAVHGVGAVLEAIEHRHAQVVVFQAKPCSRSSAQPRFAYIEDMNRQQRKMWVEVLNQGVDEGCFQGPALMLT